LVEEVRGLADRPLSRTAAEAIGYREVLAHLRGEMPLDDAFDAAVRRTRRFARRQRVWFGRDPRVRWVTGPAPVTDVVAEIITAWAEPVASATVAG
jgi:tRNA dimethylallyltransferase